MAEALETVAPAVHGQPAPEWMAGLEPDASLRIHFTRDLSTCTEEEMRLRWAAPGARVALERVGVDFEHYVKGHNPIYYLAANVVFDNVLADPAYLYAPFHRDLLAAEVLAYILGGHRTFASFLLLLPRDSFKSTFMHCAVPLWCALRWKHLYGRDTRCVLIHHREEQAAENLERLRSRSIRSTFLKTNWKEFCSDRTFGKALAFDWPCKEAGRMVEPSVFAIGLGGRATGWHFDFVFGDDLVTEEHVESAVIRQAAILKYRTNRFLLDTVRGIEMLSGTLYHINDLWGRLIKATVDNDKLYRIVQRASIADDDTLLLPFRLTKEFLERRRQEEISLHGNDVFWNLQYQLSFKAAGITFADESWFQFVAPYDLPEHCWRCIFIDPAWKGTKNHGKGDYSAIAVVLFERRGPLVLRYLADLTVSREMTNKDGLAEVLRLMKKWSVVDVAPEEHGGYSFRTDLETEAPLKGLPISIVDLKSKQTAKLERMATFLRHMNTKHFFINSALKETDQFTDHFKQQVLDFPQCKPDDALDCVAYSADPNIMTDYAPKWPLQKAKWEADARKASVNEPRFTRHCAR